MRPKPKVTTERGARTGAAILDAAERLFADSGFDAVALRDVAAAAGENLALIGYYFGSKDDLFEAVVARRAGAISQSRGEALAALDRCSKVADLPSLLDAYMKPYMELAAPGTPNFPLTARLILPLQQNERWADLMARQFDATLLQFVDRLMVCLPGLDRDIAMRGFTHAVTVMITYFATDFRLATLSQGTLRGTDPEAYSVMRQFVVGGLEALNAPNDAARARKSRPKRSSPKES